MAPFRALATCLAVLALGTGCGGDSSGIADVLVVADVVVTPSPITVVVGSSIQLAAEPRTASGITVPGRPISWSATGGAVAVSPAGVVTALSVGGPVLVRATIDGVIGEAAVMVIARPVARVTVTPTPASVTVGQFLQLTAQTFDGSGFLLAGRAVSWQSSAPETVAVTTTGIVLGMTPGGPVTITATSEGQSGTAVITAVSAPAARLGFAVQPPGGVAGQPLAPAPRVTIQNQAGGTVTTATNPVTITLASNPGGAILSGTTTVNAVAGVATFTNLRVDRAGTGYRLEAASATLTPDVSNAFATTPAIPSRLAFVTPPPSAAQSGVPLPAAPVLQVLDRDDAPVRQAGTTVSVALLSGGGTLTGILTATTDGNGLATFGALTLSGSAGTRTLQFSAGALRLNSGPIGLGSGPAARLAITTPPSAAAASGQAFAQQPVVQLRDAADNPVSQAGINVTVMIATGGGALGGTATVATNGSGAAVFSGLGITGTAGIRTLSFQSPGVSAITSGAVSVTAGSATQLTLSTQPPASVVNDVAFSVQPSVQLRDAAGNAAALAGVVVTAAIATGGGALGGTTTAMTGAGGLATFTDLKITGLIGFRTLSFSAPTATAVTSAPVTVIAGAATQLGITIQPSALAAPGQALAQQPVVQLRDMTGNPVSQAGVNVTVAIASGGGALSGTPSAATNGSGAAAFSGLALTGTAGIRTLSFQATGVTPVTSSGIELTVIGGSLALTTQPSATAANDVAFSQQPSVQLRDAAGNPAGLPGVVVTAAIATGGGLLGGTTTATTNAAGLATFTNLKITGLIGVRTLSFAAPIATAVTSSPVNITIGAATQLSLTTQPPALAVNNVAFLPQPTVQVRDAGGNAVGLAGVVVTAAIAAGGGILGGTATATTNAAGLATFTNLKITGLVGARTLSFSAPSLTAVTSAPVTVTAGAASQLALTTAPSATAASGQAFVQQPVVQLGDVSGNPVSQAGVTVTAAIASGGGTLGGTAIVATNAGGAAAFSGLSITGTVGSRTLSFQATGMTGVTSGPIALTAGSATQLTITTPASASAVNDIAFAVQPAVQLRDGAGNAVSVAGVVVTAAIATGGGTLGGNATAATNAGGLATFTNLKITGLIGARTLSFSAPGVTAVTSTPVTITAGAASQLSITTQPSATVKTGTIFPQQPVLQLRDVSGNAVAQTGITVLVTVESGPGVLSGSTSVATNAGGTAAFSKLAVTGVGNHTLRFSSGTLLPAISAPIIVTLN